MAARSDSTHLHFHRAGGFTLIEILVVLVIVGISVAAVGLTVGLTDKTRKLEQQTEQLLSWFRHIQRDAVINHATYAIDFSELKNSLSVSVYQNGEWTPAGSNMQNYPIADDTVIELHSYEDGLQEDDIDMIQFYPNMQYSPFRIVLKSSSTQAKIILRDGSEPLVVESGDTAS